MRGPISTITCGLDNFNSQFLSLVRIIFCILLTVFFLIMQTQMDPSILMYYVINSAQAEDGKCTVVKLTRITL